MAPGEHRTPEASNSSENEAILDRSTKSVELYKDRTTMHLPHLPWEILHLIFLRTVAPAWLMIPDRRPYSAWSVNVRAKLHLINVCRDWYEAGIQFLYEEIAINSIGQLCALASTLRAKSSIADMVTSIHLSFYIPTAYATMFNRIYTSLPSLCHQLTKLSFSEFFTYSERMSFHVLPSSFSQSLLTHLEVHFDRSLSLVLDGIHVVAARIVSLSLLSRNRDFPAVESPKEPLQFPRLRELQSFLDTQGLLFITQAWKFPALDTFIGRFPSCIVARDYRSLIQHILEFIQHHGQGLSTLFLHYDGDVDYLKKMTSLWKPALAKLVHLRHLIVPAFFDLSVPQVLFLDCFLSWKDPERIEKLPLLAADKRKQDFPKLQRFRYIDPSLLDFPLIYTLLPPTMSGEYHFLFPGIDIKCSPTSITDRSIAVRESEDSDDDFDFSSGSGSECEEYKPLRESKQLKPSNYSEAASDSESSEDQESSEEQEADEESCLDLWRKATFGHSLDGQLEHFFGLHKTQTNMHLPHLPWEILHSIFLRAVAPGWLIIHDRRPHSAWSVNTKTILHLINVCRDWYEAGIELLYSEIVVYSIGQFCSLASTLRANTALAEKVTSVHLSLYVSAAYATVFNRIYTSLPSLCHQLTKVVFPEFFSYRELMSYHVFPSSFRHSSLTHLEIHFNRSFAFVANGIHVVAVNLVSLSLLARNEDSGFQAAETGQEPLQFPRLQVLQSSLDTQGLSLITLAWRFPALNTFIGRPPSISDYGNRHHHRNIMQHILLFIQSHGRRLETLFLHYQGDELHSQEIAPLWEPELAKLVHLRHLIIPVFFNVSVPQVLWLDCFVGWKDVERVEDISLLAADKRKAQFPNLQRFRCIDPSLIELPLIYIFLSPNIGGEYCFSFPGIEIKCTPSSITGRTTAIREIDSSEADFGFSSGSESECDEYEPPMDLYEESESSDESAWAFDSEEEFSEDPKWEMDEETCLNLWRRRPA
ncbi:hypothetical protein C8R42DRAFT_657954 [Lentinula raphanica]|nr:hypothetical protein C8R42DRAFT_657954 [Lentinula raphanica]